MTEPGDPEVDPMAPVDINSAAQTKGEAHSRPNRTHFARKRKYRRSQLKGNIAAGFGAVLLVTIAAVCIHLANQPQADPSGALTELSNNGTRQAKGPSQKSTSAGNSSRLNPPDAPVNLPRSTADSMQNKPFLAEESRSPSTPKTNSLEASIHDELNDAERATLAQDLKEARKLIAKRQFEAAKNRLRHARTMTTHPEFTQVIHRLDTLRHYVTVFWKAVQNGTKNIEGEEFVLEGNRIHVVSCDSSRIVIRSQGKNHEYSLVDPPPKLALLLADRWFDSNASSSKVFKGAYMAVEPRLGVDMARKLWKEARQEGADIGDLESVLEDQYNFSSN